MMEFSRLNEDHMAKVTGLYYAWYGPQAAASYLQTHNIQITPQYVAQLYRGFRIARFPRFNREHALALLKPYYKTFPHLPVELTDKYYDQSK